MHRTVVLNCVGLTEALIGPHTPRLRAFVKAGKLATISPVLPAVTCSVQSTYLTGKWPGEHGIVGNGWYDRADAEVKFWKQSNALVQAPKIWDVARQIDPTFTCANLCWWYAMYSGADYTVTPRPMYPADGRKLPDCWTHPAGLRDELQNRLGQFPLFKFWGPMTGIESTRWIADAALYVEEKFSPTLSLVYLPHLDYVLQRVGPDITDAAVQKDLSQLDNVAGYLIDSYRRAGCRVIVLSEYGVGPVSVPVHLNKILRQAGLLAIRLEEGKELPDAGASAAFAVADHQLAHVYVNEPERVDEVKAILEATPGVAEVLNEKTKSDYHLDHPRAGNLVVLAKPDAWFTYYYWLDDARAPDFARTVDIHRKPGYDPAELFLNPELRHAKAKIGFTLLRRKLGFRALLDVIGLDAGIVKGSHGVSPMSADKGAMIATSEVDLLRETHVGATDVFGIILDHLQN